MCVRAYITPVSEEMQYGYRHIQTPFAIPLPIYKSWLLPLHSFLRMSFGACVGVLALPSVDMNKRLNILHAKTTARMTSLAQNGDPSQKNKQKKKRNEDERQRVKSSVRSGFCSKSLMGFRINVSTDSLGI